MDDKLHEFTSIFYTIYRWKDERDYSILFNDPNFLEARPQPTNLRCLLFAARAAELALPPPAPPPNPQPLSDTRSQEENVICSEGQHEIRNLDEHGNPLKEHRARRLSRLAASRRLAASSSAASSSSGSSGSSGSSDSAASSDEDDSGLRRFVEFGHDERNLLWAPDLHVVNEKGEPQIHSELMRMYEDGLP